MVEAKDWSIKFYYVLNAKASGYMYSLQRVLYNFGLCSRLVLR